MLHAVERSIAFCDGFSDVAAEITGLRVALTMCAVVWVVTSACPPVISSFAASWLSARSWIG